jgi:hypothetical protein
MLDKGKSIHIYDAIREITVSQDTILSVSKVQEKQDTVAVKKDTTQLMPKIPLGTIRQIDLSAVDSILLRSEERERQIELEKQQELAAQRAYYRRSKDTTEILFKQFGIAGFPLKEKLDKDAFQQNFLYNLTSFKPKEEKPNELVFIESEADQKVQYHSEIKKEPPKEPEYIRGTFQFDWITILLAVSLLMLGWVRLFNGKYLTSLVKAAVSYQESNNLYREKNSLMERASFLVNFLFLSNISIFTLQLFYYFNIDLNGTEDYILYLAVFGSLLMLYVFRALSTSLIGYVFLKQKVFSEYFHNVNIFTKNTGLAIFPIIIILQFFTYDYISLIFYLGIGIVSILYFLLYIRAFQIIIRKNVSIFYMILYLCAFEISPLLIVYKILLSVV